MKHFTHPLLTEFRKEHLEPAFKRIIYIKPGASRTESAEGYWVCKHFMAGSYEPLGPVESTVKDRGARRKTKERLREKEEAKEDAERPKTSELLAQLKEARSRVARKHRAHKHYLSSTKSEIEAET